MKNFRKEYKSPFIEEMVFLLEGGFQQTSPMEGDGFGIEGFNSEDFIDGDNSGEYMN